MNKVSCWMYSLTCDSGVEWVPLFTGGSEERCDAGSHGDTQHRLCCKRRTDRQTSAAVVLCVWWWGGERARPSKQFYIRRNHTNIYFWRESVKLRDVFPHKDRLFSVRSADWEKVNLPFLSPVWPCLTVCLFSLG